MVQLIMDFEDQVEVAVMQEVLQVQTVFMVDGLVRLVVAVHKPMVVLMVRVMMALFVE